MIAVLLLSAGVLLNILLSCTLCFQIKNCQNVLLLHFWSSGCFRQRKMQFMSPYEVSMKRKRIGSVYPFRDGTVVRALSMARLHGCFLNVGTVWVRACVYVVTGLCKRAGTGSWVRCPDLYLPDACSPSSAHIGTGTVAYISRRMHDSLTSVGWMSCMQMPLLAWSLLMRCYMALARGGGTRELQ